MINYWSVIIDNGKQISSNRKIELTDQNRLIGTGISQPIPKISEFFEVSYRYCISVHWVPVYRHQLVPLCYRYQNWAGNRVEVSEWNFSVSLPVLDVIDNSLRVLLNLVLERFYFIYPLLIFLLFLLLNKTRCESPCKHGPNDKHEV